MLRLLFVLTCADLAAVGPGVLNDWKLEVLTDLYQHDAASLGRFPLGRHRVPSCGPADVIAARTR